MWKTNKKQPYHKTLATTDTIIVAIIKMDMEYAEKRNWNLMEKNNVKIIHISFYFHINNNAEFHKHAY